MKAFVTGATGFVGSQLVDALRARGDAVTALARSAAKAETQAARRRACRAAGRRSLLQPMHEEPVRPPCGEHKGCRRHRNEAEQGQRLAQ